MVWCTAIIPLNRFFSTESISFEIPKWPKLWVANLIIDKPNMCSFNLTRLPFRSQTFWPRYLTLGSLFGVRFLLFEEPEKSLLCIEFRKTRFFCWFVFRFYSTNTKVFKGILLTFFYENGRLLFWRSATIFSLVSTIQGHVVKSPWYSSARGKGAVPSSLPI